MCWEPFHNLTPRKGPTNESPFWVLLGVFGRLLQKLIAYLGGLFNKGFILATDPSTPQASTPLLCHLCLPKCCGGYYSHPFPLKTTPPPPAKAFILGRDHPKHEGSGSRDKELHQSAFDQAEIVFLHQAGRKLCLDPPAHS